MKKITILTIAISFITFSCRQEEDILTNQDIANLKAIQETRTVRNGIRTVKNINSKNDSSLIDNSYRVYTEIIPPPNKK